MTDVTVPFLPFTQPHVDEAAIAAVAAVLRSGWITTGSRAAAFEAELSTLFGGRPVRAFSNGSVPMEIALRLSGIGPGDEVLTSPITWAATANAIVAVGAMPVFADIDPHTRNLDMDAAAAAVTRRTRAIMPVHLAGLPVDMAALRTLASRNGLRIVEDAAQAIGAQWGESTIGSIGEFVSFSFQANKNITCAEGGCLVMPTDDDAHRAERLRLQGVVRSGLDGMDVIEPGGKSNLSDVHAAIGLAQLPHLAAITARRCRLAELYFLAAADCGLLDLGIVLPPPRRIRNAITNWHMFQVLLPDGLVGGRAGVLQAMREAGIGCGVHYPALHLMSYFRSLGWREGMLPVAERVGRTTVTLPLFPLMADSEPRRVCAALATACIRAGA